MPNLLRAAASLVSIIALGGGFASAAETPSVRFETQPGRVNITVAGEPCMTYVYRDDQITRPYFTHLHAPGGVRVSRNHPPIEGVDPADHGDYHPGLWLAFGDISGHDNWRLKARVVHDRFVVEPMVDFGRGSFTVQNRYLTNDGKHTVCEETCHYTLHVRPDGGTLLVWDSTFTAPASDGFTFGDQEEMGLGIRIASPLAVNQDAGGRILNAEGLRDEEQVWGQPSAWCDYGGPIDGRFVGITLMTDPANFRPCWYHARDYGLLLANPFGREAFRQGEKSTVSVKAGESFRLRFGILLHATPGDTFDGAAAYANFLELFEASGSARVPTP